MSVPLVSVCVPTRGDARFLGPALTSVLEQDVELEVVVVDDGGSGAAGTAVRDAGDPRVRYHRHRRARGVAAARNRCLAEARGRYVAWLDDDDDWPRGSLGARLAMLEADRRIALVHGAAEIVDADGRPLPRWWRPFDADTVEPGPDAFAELILGNQITTSSVVARTETLRRAGGFVASGPSSSDWDMWLRVALRGDVAYRAAATVRYRQHPASITATAAAAARLACDVRVVRRVLAAEHASVPDPRATARRARRALAARATLHAEDLRTQGERTGALRETLRAARLAPEARGAPLAALVRATLRNDRYRAHTATRTLLGALAGGLEGSRYGARLTAACTTDPAWDAALSRMAAAVRRTTEEDAVVATVAKWDPTLLHRCGRRGRQFPDRRLLPEGFPADGATAAAHLDRLCAEGVTHLVLPRAWSWWLEHYAELAARLGAPLHADGDCQIFRTAPP